MGGEEGGLGLQMTHYIIRNICKALVITACIIIILNKVSVNRSHKKQCIQCHTYFFDILGIGRNVEFVMARLSEPTSMQRAPATSL